MTADSLLQQAVLDELSWEPSVTAGHIGVSAAGGVVTLTGTVESYAEKHAAETAARRVRDVKGVAEQIKVRLPVNMTRTDAEIAQAALGSMSWDVSVPTDAVKVTVANGWVTLTGEVEWRYQRQAAEQDVRRLHGILGVANLVTIKPGVDVGDLGDTITHALGRSWFFDPKTVSVSAVGGKVHLTGEVHSWHDRVVAEDAAWAAPGVTKVENDISIIS